MSKCKHIKRVRFDDARSWEYASLDLSPHVNVFVGDEECRRLDGLDTSVAPGTVVHLIGAVSGG